MLLFRNQTEGKKKQPEPEDNKDKAAQAIAGVILNRQKQLASFCNARYERLSLPGRKALLLLFCLLFGCASLWFLAKGIWPEQKPQATIQGNYADSLHLARPVPRGSINFYK